MVDAQGFVLALTLVVLLLPANPGLAEEMSTEKVNVSFTEGWSVQLGEETRPAKYVGWTNGNTTVYLASMQPRIIQFAACNHEFTHAEFYFDGVSPGSHHETMTVGEIAGLTPQSECWPILTG